MANIEAIAEGIGLMLSGAQALEIKNKLDKLTKNQTKKDIPTKKIEKVIKEVVTGPPNMADVAGGIRMNKNRIKSGKDMIKTTTLGKKGDQGYSKGGSIKVYSKGGGVRKPKMTAGY